MSNTYPSSWLTYVSFTVILMALLIIQGWLFDIAALRTFGFGPETMRFNIALCLLLSGILLLYISLERWDKKCLVLVFLIITIGLITISQYLFSINLGIDQLLVTDSDRLKNKFPFPCQTSPVSALCFALYAFAILCLKSKTFRHKKIGQYLLHFITLLSYISLLGYLFSVPNYYKLSFLSSLAAPTALSLLILSVSSSFIQKDRGVTGIFTGTNTGNIVVRKLFPKIAIAIILLTSLELYILKHQLISIDFGIILLSTSYIIVSLFFIEITSKQLNRIDIKRIQAEIKTIKANKNLEKTVIDRTFYLTNQNKQLEDFAHIISHNLRGPVSNLNSLLDFYKEEKTGDEKEELMKMFETTVNNIGTTLNELLEVISIRHQSKSERTTIAFETVYSKIIETFQGQILKSKAVVTADFSNAPEIEYSSTYLESIMQNLLSNSLKYCSPERTPVIHFKTSRQENNIVLTVKDNGLGIDLSKNKSLIFGLHKTFHQHPDSKGIGLFLTKAQIEAMGGKISVTSAVNQGTTFKIVFYPKPLNIDSK